MDQVNSAQYTFPRPDSIPKERVRYPMQHKNNLSLAQVPPQDGARSGRYYNKRPAAAERCHSAAAAGAGVLTVMRATSGLVWQQTVEQHQ